MARPSKARVAVHEDRSNLTGSGMYDPSLHAAGGSLQLFDDDDVSQDGGSQYGRSSEGSTLDQPDDSLDATNLAPTDTEEEDEARRESAFTSISSLPDSTFETDDNERSLPIYAATIRPPFRRPESVRRMQLTSPTPFERSPRRSVLHHRTKSATPRLVRTSAKGSPFARKRQEEEMDEEKKDYPLVLLHITLLPVELRWSPQSTQEILPASVLENLQLLRSKVSETVVQRGILIPHPRDEYELLEERLLEALELKKERVTKCGHFRARDSTSSMSSAEGSVRSGDSGIGFGMREANDEVCTTCHSPVKCTDSGAGEGGQKWSIKVFAANGLMRASAWSAAWSEMERVDVEVLPAISDRLRRQLDARLVEEEAEKRHADEEARIQEVVEEQVRIAHERRKWESAEEMREIDEALRLQETLYDPLRVPVEETLSSDTLGDTATDVPIASAELPQVYRSRDIPLSLLLKNYVFLLAQDKRNLVIFALSIMALWMSLRVALTPSAVEITSLSPTCDTSSTVEQPVFPLDTDLEIGIHLEATNDFHANLAKNASQETLLIDEVIGFPEPADVVATEAGDISLDISDVEPSGYTDPGEQIETQHEEIESIMAPQPTIEMAADAKSEAANAPEDIKLDEVPHTLGKDQAGPDGDQVCVNPVAVSILFDAMK